MSTRTASYRCCSSPSSRLSASPGCISSGVSKRRAQLAAMRARIIAVGLSVVAGGMPPNDQWRRCRLKRRADVESSAAQISRNLWTWGDTRSPSGDAREPLRVRSKAGRPDFPPASPSSASAVVARFEASMRIYGSSPIRECPRSGTVQSATRFSDEYHSHGHRRTRRGSRRFHGWPARDTG